MHGDNPDLNEEYFSWSAYSASMQTPSGTQRLSIALIPQFTNNAPTVDMIQHSIKVGRCSCNLQKDKVPVLAMDQLLFALAAQIQWDYREIYDEGKFVILFGGMHIERTALTTISTNLEGVVLYYTEI